MIRTFFLFFSAVALFIRPAVSDIINIPFDYATIQEGINAAREGDTVLVASNTYTGDGNRDIDFMGKGIVVTSRKGPEYTIIDCQGSDSEPHRAFIFAGGETESSVLSGFTIRGGYADSAGGVLCYYSTPVIRNCIFKNNTAKAGGALAAILYQPTVAQCVFDSNTANYGGALWLTHGGDVDSCLFTSNHTRIWGSAVYAGGITARNCIFKFNTGGSFVLRGGNGFYLDHCLIAENPISAVYFGGIPTVINCTIVNNNGGIYVSFLSNPILENNVIAFNDSLAVWCFKATGPDDPQTPPDPTLMSNNIFSNLSDYTDCIGGDYGLNGNISIDPRFCDIAAGDYHLAENSFCVGSGTGGENIGAFDVGCGPVAVDDDIPSTIPTEFALSQNYPNPFNPCTIIKYSIPTKTHVEVSILNILGQKILTLVDEEQPAGNYRTEWDGCDAGGNLCATGIYFFKINAGKYSDSKKMVLLK